MMLRPSPGMGWPGDGVRRGRVPRGGDPAGGTGPAGNPGPWLVADPDVTSGTGLILFPQAGALPAVWAGPVPGGGLEPGDAAALLRAARPGPLLPQHGEGWFGLPGLSGHRLDPGGHPAAGRDWSPRFQPVRWEPGERRTLIEAEDAIAGLRLVTEADAVPGGAIRVRHTVTNTGRQPYVVDSLEVVFPLPGRAGEVLDFTGRQTASASRSGTGSATGCGCARAAAATPGTTRPRSWSRAYPASGSATARCSGCTWRGAVTRCTGSNGCPPDWAWCTGARPRPRGGCCRA